MSDKNLIQVQAARQTVFGTPVTPMTVKLMMVDDFKTTPILDVKRFTNEMRGSMAPAHVAVLTKQAVQGQLKMTATYEDLPYLLEAIFGVATPSGAGPYVRTGAAPTTAVVASPRMFTFTVGESVDGSYQVDGAVGTKLALSIKNAAEMMATLDFIGFKTESGGTLAALSDRTVTPIMASDLVPYIDTWGGTIGSTAFAANVYSLDYTIDTKRDLRYYLGAITPGRYREPNKWDATLKMVMEFVAASPNTKALLDAILALTPGTLFNKQVRAKATNGTNIFQIDHAGVNEKAPDLWSYDNNVQTIDLNLAGQYNTTLGNFAAYSVTNSVAVLA